MLIGRAPEISRAIRLSLSTDTDSKSGQITARVYYAGHNSDSLFWEVLQLGDDWKLLFDPPPKPGFGCIGGYCTFRSIRFEVAPRHGRATEEPQGSFQLDLTNDENPNEPSRPPDSARPIGKKRSPEPSSPVKKRPVPPGKRVKPGLNLHSE